MSKEVKQKKKSLNRSTRTGVNSKTRQKTNCTIKLQFTHIYIKAAAKQNGE
jgi:hypothetical protein